MCTAYGSGIDVIFCVRDCSHTGCPQRHIACNSTTDVNYIPLEQLDVHETLPPSVVVG